MADLMKYASGDKEKVVRYNAICKALNLKPEDKILDIGCGNGLGFSKFNHENPITGIDIEKESSYSAPNFTFISMDAEDLSQFRDKEFDVAITVGVLEHIRPKEKLLKMASEIQRVAKGYCMVVPDNWTLIEPHYQLPLWQKYPKFLKRLIMKRMFRIGIYYGNKEGTYEDLVFLGYSEWRKIFKEAKLKRFSHRKLFGIPVVTNLFIYKPAR